MRDRAGRVRSGRGRRLRSTADCRSSASTPAASLPAPPDATADSWSAAPDAYLHAAIAAWGEDAALWLYRARCANSTTCEHSAPRRRAPGRLDPAGRAARRSRDRRRGRRPRGRDQDCDRHEAALRAHGIAVERYDGSLGRGLFLPDDAAMNPARRAIGLAAQLRDRRAPARAHPRHRDRARQVSTERGTITRRVMILVAVDGRLDLLAAAAGRPGAHRTAADDHDRTGVARVGCPARSTDGGVTTTRSRTPTGGCSVGGGRDRFDDDEWTNDAEPSAQVQGYLAHLAARFAGAPVSRSRTAGPLRSGSRRTPTAGRCARRSTTAWWRSAATTAPATWSARWPRAPRSRSLSTARRRRPASLSRLPSAHSTVVGGSHVITCSRCRSARRRSDRVGMRRQERRPSTTQAQHRRCSRRRQHQYDSAASTCTPATLQTHSSGTLTVAHRLAGVRAVVRRQQAEQRQGLRVCRRLRGRPSSSATRRARSSGSSRRSTASSRRRRRSTTSTSTRCRSPPSGPRSSTSRAATTTWRRPSSRSKSSKYANVDHRRRAQGRQARRRRRARRASTRSTTSSSRAPARASSRPTTSPCRR